MAQAKKRENLLVVLCNALKDNEQPFQETQREFCSG